jgi:hypothetical protein
LLLAFPFTVAVAILFPNSNTEAVIHIALATGTFILGLSLLDFAITPRALTWTACASASLLAAIFLGQGLVGITQNETLRSIAYSQVLGAWGETITLFVVMVWFMQLARSYGRSLTMILGVLTSVLVIGISLWAVVAAPPGGTPAEMRLLFLLPIAWYLFVTTRRSPTY